MFLLNSAQILNKVEGKLFSPQHHNKESLTTSHFERLNFEQLLCKPVFEGAACCRTSHKKWLMESLETKSSRPRRNLRSSRPRLDKTALEMCLETEIKSWDSIIGSKNVGGYYVEPHEAK